MGYLGHIVTKVYAGPLKPAPGALPTLDPGNADFTLLVQRIINVILILAGTLAVVYLIYSGIQYITASGDATKATAARTGIINAIIGIVIIALSFAISGWIFNGLSTNAGL